MNSNSKVSRCAFPPRPCHCEPRRGVAISLSTRARGMPRWFLVHRTGNYPIYEVLPVVLSVLFLSSFVDAAQIYARKMAIIRLPTGQATQFSDSVVITDDGTVITSRNAVLSETEDWAILSDAVVIQTPEVEVWADSVEYDFRLKLAHIRAHPHKAVKVTLESLEITAPEIEYFFLKGLVEAPLCLELSDKRGSFTLTGRKGSYQIREQVGVVDSMPCLTVKSEPPKEPVLVTAERMLWMEEQALVKGLGAVNVRSGDGAIVADTALFYIDRDSGVAWGNSLVADSAGMAKADTLIFLLDNRSLSRVVFIGGAQGAYRTAGGDTVAVKGTELSLDLQDGKIVQITVANLISGQLIRSKVRSSQFPEPRTKNQEPRTN